MTTARACKALMDLRRHYAADDINLTLATTDTRYMEIILERFIQDVLETYGAGFDPVGAATRAKQAFYDKAEGRAGGMA